MSLQDHLNLPGGIPGLSISHWLSQTHSGSLLPLIRCCQLIMLNIKFKDERSAGEEVLASASLTPPENAYYGRVERERRVS